MLKQANRQSTMLWTKRLYSTPTSLFHARTLQSQHMPMPSQSVNQPASQPGSPILLYPRTTPPNLKSRRSQPTRRILSINPIVILLRL